MNAHTAPTALTGLSDHGELVVIHRLRQLGSQRCAETRMDARRRASLRDALVHAARSHERRAPAWLPAQRSGQGTSAHASA